MNKTLFSYTILDLSQLNTSSGKFCVAANTGLTFDELREDLLSHGISLDDTEEGVRAIGDLFTVEDNDDDPQLMAICFESDFDVLRDVAFMDEVVGGIYLIKSHEATANLN